MRSPSGATGNVPASPKSPPVVSYEVGDVVTWQRGSVPYHGVVKWVGILPGQERQVAGIELVSQHMSQDMILPL